MAFNVEQKQRNRSWTDLLVEKSDLAYQQEGLRRKRTFRRMYMTVFVLSGAAFLIYCSMFYIGAFYDVRSLVLGTSQAERTASAQQNIETLKPETQRTLMSPFVDAFALNRVYLRKNQKIIATYSLPDDVRLVLEVKQCKQMPVVEVFSCKFIGQQQAVIRNNDQGHKTFTVSEPGFYYFKAEAVKAPNQELKLNHNYKVIWRRG